MPGADEKVETSSPSESQPTPLPETPSKEIPPPIIEDPQRKKASASLHMLVPYHPLWYDQESQENLEMYFLNYLQLLIKCEKVNKRVTLTQNVHFLISQIVLTHQMKMDLVHAKKRNAFLLRWLCKIQEKVLVWAQDTLKKSREEGCKSHLILDQYANGLRFTNCYLTETLQRIEDSKENLPLQDLHFAYLELQIASQSPVVNFIFDYFAAVIVPKCPTVKSFYPSVEVNPDPKTPVVVDTGNPLANVEASTPLSSEEKGQPANNKLRAGRRNKKGAKEP